VICPKCQAALGKITAAGEPSIRMRGIVLKASGPVAICPKCGHDVAFSPDLAKAIHTRILIRADGGRLAGAKKG
jgi:hypothetical protein